MVNGSNEKLIIILTISKLSIFAPSFTHSTTIKLMWHKTIAQNTREAGREQVWKVLTDVNHWQEWDPEIEWTELKGELRTGADFMLKPKGGPKTRLTVTQMERPGIFADIAHLPLAKMHTIHTLSETSEGLKIQMDIKISGLLSFLWSKVIGQGQIDGGPQQIERLIAKAKTL